MCRLTRSLFVVALWLALVPAAQAQTVGLKHLWTVPGVMNTSNGVGTFIACTNSGTAAANIAVDVYGPTGTFVAGNSIPVAPNSTVIFGTSSAAGVSVDVNLATPTVTKGHARVFADSTKGVLCSAFLADAVSNIPSGMTTLTVAKAFKQKGD